MPAWAELLAGHRPRRGPPARWPRAGAGRRPSGVRLPAGRVRRLRVSEQPAAGDALVPRPRPGHHPAQRLHGHGGLLPDPGRLRERPRSAGGSVRDPDRRPGPDLQPGRLVLLPADDPERLLRRQDPGQRQGLAVPRRQAGQVPLPLPQRLAGTHLPAAAREPGGPGAGDSVRAHRHRRRPDLGADHARRLRHGAGGALRRGGRLRAAFPPAPRSCCATTTARPRWCPTC